MLSWTSLFFAIRVLGSIQAAIKVADERNAGHAAMLTKLRLLFMRRARRWRTFVG